MANNALDNATGTVFVDYVRKARPKMRESSVLQGDHWRIGILTESLIRFEWSDSGEFEDNLTQMVVNRDFGADTQFTVSHRDGLLIVDTPALYVTYDGKPFSKEGLSVVVKGVADTQFNTWYYGDEPKHNLKGTARTLDEANGEIPLDDGVISRDGWAVLDDSAANVIVEAHEVNGKPNPLGAWVMPRDHAETDFYFFGYGRRYTEAVQDFYKLAGPTPLLPRFALGNWWSRYYRYTQDEYLQLMDRFKREGIPFTTSVIDMDWHRVDDVDPKYGSGWTGYSWDKQLFPDHEAFLRDLHERGLKATLNVHPRDGVRAFEDDYEAVAKRVGIDPATEEAVEFDLTNPDFVSAYFDMHHRMEAEGVDFWWLDWQQGGVTRQPGLDPLWVLNHLHYLDSGRYETSSERNVNENCECEKCAESGARDEHEMHVEQSKRNVSCTERNNRWPLTFSRYAGPGSHRYPVGFSGDTIVTWESLQFQPYFTATASNIGYGWWSHDIGGHMCGYRNEHLEARWYQLGTFSPINRLHSSNSQFMGKEPWNFSAEVRDSMVGSLRLRHMMLPYLYTMNYRAAFEGMPLVEPMYWADPNNPQAYEVPDEFRFGTELLVAPIVSDNDESAQLGSTEAWLPQGEWYDFFDGRRYVSAGESGRRLEVWRAIDRMPVFAKAGGIVPLQQLGEGNKVNDLGNPESLQVLVFPGANGSFTLKEDDGSAESGEDQTHVADTRMSFDWKNTDNATQFTVSPVEGCAVAIPAQRNWEVVFRGVAQPDMQNVRIEIDGKACDTAEITYDQQTLSLSVVVRDVPSTACLNVTISDGLQIAENSVEQDVLDVLLHAQMPYISKEHAMQTIREQGVRALGALRTFDTAPRFSNELFGTSGMPDSVISALEEILLRS
ncbi:TIM-barrel domain-containing protein [Bifidobacterium sp. YIT 13610]|uniref:glycoside hydrolase family 31 protein n=1 Tax=Bifidobacterium sp. YIT 13610 TaxID=3383156 RepID=UPI003D347298